MLIINSEYSRKNFKEIGLNNNLMHTIIGGVDTTTFMPVTIQTRNTIRKHLGLPINTTILLSVCRLVTFKGLEYVLQATAQLLYKYNIQYVLIGDGPDKQRLTSIVKQLGIEDSVIFAGEVPMTLVDQYYKATDIYALSPVEIEVQIGKHAYTHTETMGRSFCEAMATNLPIVASNVGGIPEVLANYKSSILVPQKDADSIVKALDTLLNLDHATSNQPNTTHISHSWNTIFTIYESLFVKK